MNLEIATRLVGLRKANKLSQEALAEKLGISRQAVSKWERAEASPDTDNLIALAKLYHVSLDELLKINEEEETDSAGGVDVGTDGIAGGSAASAGMRGAESEVLPVGMRGAEGEVLPVGTQEVGESITEQVTGSSREGGQEGTGVGEDDVYIGLKGIHVKSHSGEEVHIDRRGIHVRDMKSDVHIGGNGVFVNGEKVRSVEIPLGVLAIIIYIVIGFCFDLWHPGWLLFILIPIISSLVDAVCKRDASLFLYPVFAFGIFLYAGIVHTLWHPAWVIFLTIPIFYFLTGAVKDRAEKE